MSDGGVGECGLSALGTEMGDVMLETLILTPRAAGTRETRGGAGTRDAES